MLPKLPVFWRHTVTVLTGTAAAQVLPLLAAPLITRMCTPGDLGAFGIWVGIVAIASTVSTLRLEAAMILDHDPSAQQTCFSVIVYFSTAIAIILTLCAVLARQSGLPHPQSMSWFALLTIGIATWVTAYTNTMSAYATSYRAFGKAALVKVYGAGAIALSQVSLLWFGVDGNSLFAGHIIGLGVGMAAAIILLSPPYPQFGIASTKAQRIYLEKHQSFWRYSLPAGLLNIAAGKFPLFLIGAKYGLVAAGLFALTECLLTAPVSLLATSVREVFKRESVHEFQTLGNCTRAYRNTFKGLVLLGLGPALFIFAFAPDMCAWVFGEPWREAGVFARILAPLYFLNFVASPLSYVFFVAGKQKIEFVWQIALFITTIAIFLAPLPLTKILWNYTIAYSLLYVVYLYLSHRFSRNVVSLENSSSSTVEIDDSRL
jgi:O-antigen/teichoic acid export membrane protein